MMEPLTCDRRATLRGENQARILPAAESMLTCIERRGGAAIHKASEKLNHLSSHDHRLVKDAPWKRLGKSLQWKSRDVPFLQDRVNLCCGDRRAATHEIEVGMRSRLAPAHTNILIDGHVPGEEHPRTATPKMSAIAARDRTRCGGVVGKGSGEGRSQRRTASPPGSGR